MRYIPSRLNGQNREGLLIWLSTFYLSLYHFINDLFIWQDSFWQIMAKLFLNLFKGFAFGPIFPLMQMFSKKYFQSFTSIKNHPKSSKITKNHPKQCHSMISSLIIFILPPNTSKKNLIHQLFPCYLYLVN